MDRLPLPSQQAFFAAVRSADLEALRRIFEGGDGAVEAPTVAGLRAMQNEEGQTGLYVAAAGNLEEVFRYLVKFYDFEAAATKSNVGTTALHAAAKNGHTGEDRFVCAASGLLGSR